jgi:hypothetical protein
MDLGVNGGILFTSLLPLLCKCVLHPAPASCVLPGTLLQRTVKRFQLARQLSAALACGMWVLLLCLLKLGALMIVNAAPATFLLLQRTIKPFQLGRQLSAASGEPNHGYGLLLMPRKLGATPGVIIGIVWSTDDWEQLDVSEMSGDPVGFSHTCHNYIGVGLDGNLARS